MVKHGSRVPRAPLDSPLITILDTQILNYIIFQPATAVEFIVKMRATCRFFHCEWGPKNKELWQTKFNQVWNYLTTNNIFTWGCYKCSNISPGYNATMTEWMFIYDDRPLAKKISPLLDRAKCNNHHLDLLLCHSHNQEKNRITCKNCVRITHSLLNYKQHYTSTINLIQLNNKAIRNIKGTQFAEFRDTLQRSTKKLIRDVLCCPKFVSIVNEVSLREQRELEGYIFDQMIQWRNNIVREKKHKAKRFTPY